METFVCNKTCQGIDSYRCPFCPKEAYTFSLAQPSLKALIISNWEAHGAPQWAAPIIRQLGLTDKIQLLDPRPPTAPEPESERMTPPTPETATQLAGLDLQRPATRAAEIPVFKVTQQVSASKAKEPPPRASSEKQPSVCAPASLTAEVPAWRSPGSVRNILGINVE